MHYIAISSVFSHTNATIQGLSTIRVFKAQSILESEFHEYVNDNTAAWYLKLTTTRAFALWLDLVCLIYIVVVTLSFVIVDSEGKMGISICKFFL